MAMKQYCDGGEAILEAFRLLGVDYIISSPGSEWSPMWEAMARQKVNQKAGPHYIDCWHETLAVDMAMGYTQITGKPQAVLLHAGAGLLQGTAGMHSAVLAEVPMVIMSGESLTFGENPALDIEGQWYRSLSIIGGPQRLVEPVTKWATQVTSVHTLYESVIRAFEFAQRTPAGPVYLNVPLETMVHDWTPPEGRRPVPPVPKTQAKPADVERIADLVAKAKNPVIMAGNAGRDPRSFAALVELADLIGAPVGANGASYANFPKNHPMHMGYRIDRYLKESDLVLCVCCRAPWYPPSKKPTDGIIVAIDENPLKGSMVYQTLMADHYLEGEVYTSLKLLVEASKAAGVTSQKTADRHQRWRREHDTMVAAEIAAEKKAASNGNGIEPLALIGAMRDSMPKDTIYVEETITHSQPLQQHLPWTDPQSYFRVGGGLGQGTGYALGVKLASAQRPVALVVGDGSFLYNPVVQALGASRGSNLPVLMIVMNNRKYAAMQKGHLHHYPDGVAMGADMYHGVHIDGPAYDELGKPFGLHGQKVEKVGELKGAIEAGLKSVKDGKTSILNVSLTQ
ncbi:MAG TPA: thiamine pyrophosphate-binding protein [Stellaceae bacterium]|nr:thiamine pyrophosphate-binding protein [Stellaceae bacterium]